MKFNERGLRTLVLSESDSESARAAAIERLAGDEGEDALDYIISVDYYLDRMTATGEVKEFTMPNTDKSVVEIEWRWILRSEKISMSILSMDNGH